MPSNKYVRTVDVEKGGLQIDGLAERRYFNTFTGDHVNHGFEVIITGSGGTDLEVGTGDAVIGLSPFYTTNNPDLFTYYPQVINMDYYIIASVDYSSNNPKPNIENRYVPMNANPNFKYDLNGICEVPLHLFKMPLGETNLNNGRYYDLRKLGDDKFFVGRKVARRLPNMSNEYLEVQLPQVYENSDTLEIELLILSDSEGVNDRRDVGFYLGFAKDGIPVNIVGSYLGITSYIPTTTGDWGFITKDLIPKIKGHATSGGATNVRIGNYSAHYGNKDAIYQGVHWRGRIEQTGIYVNNINITGVAKGTDIVTGSDVEGLFREFPSNTNATHLRIYVDGNVAPMSAIIVKQYKKMNMWDRIKVYENMEEGE